MHRLSSNVIVYIAILAVFTVIDAAWLAVVAADVFKRQVGPILSEKPNLWAALAFYVIYAGGLLVLAVRPALEQRRPGDAIVKGAVLGLTAYATFDLTKLAIIKGWSLGLALFDMAWGTALSAVAAACGYAIGARLQARFHAGDAMRPE